MSVHYKFKAALDYSTVTFDGIHITVSDLKKEIVEQKRLGKNADFDLQIINAQTKEVYEDESALIPKNTSVIVARIPFTDKKKASAASNNLTGGGNQSLQHKNAHYRNLPLNSQNTTSKSVDLTTMDGTEEDKIKAMMNQSTADYDPTRYVRIRGASQHGRVPDSYRCFKCNHPGHWIKNCPLLQSENTEVKKSTGIPRSFMVVVDGPDVPGALITPEGRYAVPAVDHAAYLEKGKHQAIEAPIPKPKIPDHLLCNLCQDLLTDALLVPCCANSYCDDCIRSALLESDEQECPGCHEKEISPNTLIPNRFLRTAVNAFKNETGYSKPVKVTETVVRIDQSAIDAANRDARKLSLDELPDDLFPHSPRKIDTDAEDSETNSKNNANEIDKTDLYDFNEGSIPSPFASPKRNKPKIPDTENEQAIRTIGMTVYDNPIPKDTNRPVKTPLQTGMPPLPPPQHPRNKPVRASHPGGRSPGFNEVFPPGEEQMLNKDMKLSHGHHHDGNEHSSNMPPRTAPGLLPLPGIPPFNPRQPPPGFNASGPPPQRMPPPNMFPGPPGVANNGPPGVNQPMNVNPNFPPFNPNFRMPPHSGGGPPPQFNQGGPGPGRPFNRGRSPPGDMDRYQNRDKMRRPMQSGDMRDRERPMETRGAIDDPLKEFERIMREKDRRKKQSTMLKRSRSRSRSRSFSPALRRSQSPFPKRSRSRSYSRSPSPKRKRPLPIRRRKSYSRSHSRSPLRRLPRSRSRSRNRTPSPLPGKRRSPRRAPPFSPSPPMGRFTRKDKDDYVRKEKDDYIRKDKDDYLRKEKDDYIRKEKEDYIRKEKDDYIRKEKDDYLRKEKDDYLRKEKDDYLRKEKDDYLRKDKDDYLRKDKDDYLRKDKDDYLRKDKDDYGRKDKDDYGRKDKDDYGRKDKDDYGRKEKDDYIRKDKDDYNIRKEKEEYFDSRPRYDDRPMRYGGKHYSRDYDPKFESKIDGAKYDNPIQSKFDQPRGHKFDHNMGRPMGRGFHGNSQHHHNPPPQPHYMEHEREKPMIENFHPRPYDFDPNIAPPGTEPLVVPSLFELNIPPPRQHTPSNVYTIQNLANQPPPEVYFKEGIKPKGPADKELELDSVSMTPESEHERDSKEIRRHRKKSTESRVEEKKIKKDKKKHKKKNRDDKEKKSKKKKSKGLKLTDQEEEGEQKPVSQSLETTLEEEPLTAKIEPGNVNSSPSVESRQTVPDSTVKSPERVKDADILPPSVPTSAPIKAAVKNPEEKLKTEPLLEFREDTCLDSLKPLECNPLKEEDIPYENMNSAFKKPDVIAREPEPIAVLAVQVPTSKWDRDEYEVAEASQFHQSLDVPTPIEVTKKEESISDKEIVTSEVLKRAENAIFEKTIGVIPRVTDTKKIVPSEYQRKKDSSEKYRSKTETESMLPKESHDGGDTASTASSNTVKPSRTSPVHSSVSKRSVKERLGSKLTDDEVSRNREDSDDKAHIRSQISTARDSNSSRDRDRRYNRRSRSPERKVLPYRPLQRPIRRSPRRSRDRSRPRRVISPPRARQYSRSKSRDRRKSRSPRRYSPSSSYRRRPRSRTRSPRSRNFNSSRPVVAALPIHNDTEEVREPSPPGVNNKPLLETTRQVTVEKVEPEWTKLSDKFVPIGFAETSFTPSPPPSNLRIRTEQIPDMSLTSPGILPFRKQRGRINIKLSSSSKAEERSSSSSTEDGDRDSTKSSKKPRTSVEKESNEDNKDDKKKRKEKKERKKAKRRSKSDSSSSSDDAKHKKSKRKKKKKNKKKKSK